MQNLHLPLGFMIALPLAHEVLPNINPQLWLAAISLLFLFRLDIIRQSHPFYTNRTAVIENLLEKIEGIPYQQILGGK